MMVRNLDAIERRLGRIAEVAMMSATRSAFRSTIMQELDSDLGLDFLHMGSFCLERQIFDVQARGFDYGSILEGHEHKAMSELAEQELQALRSRVFMPVESLFSQRRRTRLTGLRNYLDPLKVSSSTAHIWGNRTYVGVFMAGRRRHAQLLGPSELERISAIMPQIKLGDAFLALRDAASEEREVPSFQVWALDVGLSGAERAVAELTIRGLRNREIAQLLGISIYTVRNQLSAVFKKANVSTRAELVFAFSEASAVRSRSQRPRWVTKLEAPCR